MTKSDLIAYLEENMSSEQFLLKYIAYRGYGTRRLPHMVMFMLEDKISYAVEYMAREFNLSLITDKHGNLIKYL